METLASFQNFVIDDPLGRFIALFLIAGFLARVFRSFFSARKIQPNGFKWRTVRNEVLFATRNLVVVAFTLAPGTKFLTDHGYITFNPEPRHSHSWRYLRRA